MSESTWLTCAEVAQRWRMTPREIQRMVKGGELAHMRLGRRIRISADAVTDYERAHTRRRRSRPVAL